MASTSSPGRGRQSPDPTPRRRTLRAHRTQTEPQPASRRRPASRPPPMTTTHCGLLVARCSLLHWLVARCSLLIAHHSSRSTGRSYTTDVGFYYGSGQPPRRRLRWYSRNHRDPLGRATMVRRPARRVAGSHHRAAFIFWLFTINGFLGLAAILVIIAPVVARGVWEAKHPPDIR